MDNKIRYYDENDLVLKLEDTLAYDNLFNHIKEREILKKELFHPNFIAILEKDPHKWYSVAEAGRILGTEKPIPPSSLNYYIDNLGDYILPDEIPSNKFVRLNYLSLVKLRMVWLLKDELKLSGLKAEVGIFGSVVKNKEVVPQSNEQKQEQQQYNQMTEYLFKTFMEIGRDGQPRIKEEIQQLLSSQKLLEEQSQVLKKLEEQEKSISDLAEENKILKEKIKQIPSELEKSQAELRNSLEENQKKDQSIREEKLSSLTESFRARSQAEKEWDQKGIFARAFGNKSEFIESRIKELLNQN